MPNPTQPQLVCPVCKGDHMMEFACKFGQMEIYGCRQCGATLSVPRALEPTDRPRT